MRSIISWFLILVFSMGGPLSACPVFVFPKDLRAPLLKTAIGKLALFTRGDAGDGWREADLQVDPIDAQGRYIFFRKAADIFEEPLAATDRLVFAPSSFGQRFTGGTMPCDAKETYEIEDGRRPGRYVYIAACSKRRLMTRLAPINIDEKKREVVAPGYVFRYNEKNHILFDDISWRGRGAAPPVAKHARLRIRADVPKFFTFNFDSEDVLSKIEAFRRGKLGFIGFASFYLRVLFFNVDLKLTTGVSFWEDSVHVPMVMNMPIEPRRWLHPASGIIYSWLTNPDNTAFAPEPGDMPTLAVQQVKAGPDALAKIGRRYCARQKCFYRLLGMSGATKFAMDFMIPETLVKKGFFPFYLPDVQRAEVELGWRAASGEKTKPRIGLFYETSGLEKGEHQWDFWIRLTSQGDDLAAHCPYPAR